MSRFISSRNLNRLPVQGNQHQRTDDVELHIVGQVPRPGHTLKSKKNFFPDSQFGKINCTITRFIKRLVCVN